MDLLTYVASVAGDIMGVIALLAMLVKPIRRRLFADQAARDGQKCLLRAEILRLYYHNQQSMTLRQYEAQNLELMYKAYKALGGNSFIDRIYGDMEGWSVRT